MERIKNLYIRYDGDDCPYGLVQIGRMTYDFDKIEVIGGSLVLLSILNDNPLDYRINGIFTLTNYNIKIE